MGTDMPCAHVSQALWILNWITWVDFSYNLQQNFDPNGVLFFKIVGESWSQIFQKQQMIYVRSYFAIDTLIDTICVVGVWSTQVIFIVSLSCPLVADQKTVHCQVPHSESRSLWYGVASVCKHVWDTQTAFSSEKRKYVFLNCIIGCIINVMPECQWIKLLKLISSLI